MLDAIKDLGYHYSTIGSLTVAIADMTVPQKKYELIGETEKEIVKIDRQYRRGLITNDERYRLSVEAWDDTTKKVTTALQESMDRYNPIFMMADSGARGSMAQIRQLAGMRGLMADTSGRTIEIPIKSNFREGLSVLEYFISSRGRPEGHGRHRSAYRRLGLPDPPSGGRVPGGHHPGGRLRYRRRHRGQRDRGARPGHRDLRRARPRPLSHRRHQGP